MSEKSLAGFARVLFLQHWDQGVLDKTGFHLKINKHTSKTDTKLSAENSALSGSAYSSHRGLFNTYILRYCRFKSNTQV